METTDKTTPAPPVESAVGHTETQEETSKFEPTSTFEGVRRQMAAFAKERDWDQHHTPRNLVLALSGEMGELCECFQWKGDHLSVDDWTPAEREHLGEELSDVALYLVRLADRCNIDLATAIQDKMVKNARKYPANLVKGSSQKYTAYSQQVNADRDGGVAKPAQQ